MDPRKIADAFKAEHSDAWQAIFDQGEKSGSVKGGEDAVKLERERIESLSTCASFAGRADFILTQVRAGHDLGKAKSDFADLLAKENQQLRQEKAEVERREALANAAHPQGEDFAGARVPVRATNADPKHDFETKVAEQVKSGKSRQQAVAAVATADPALHQAYLESFNSRK